jgi:hypothetical protein
MTIRSDTLQDLYVRIKTKRVWPALPVGAIVFYAAAFPGWRFSQHASPKEGHKTRATIGGEWLWRDHIEALPATMPFRI